MTKIKDMPRFARPREKLIEKGAQNLKGQRTARHSARHGRAGKNVLEVAEEILAKQPDEKFIGARLQKISRNKRHRPGQSLRASRRV